MDFSVFYYFFFLGKMEWNFDIQTASCQFQQYTMAFVTWRKEFVCIICECGLINVWLQLERRLLWESTAVVSSQKTHSNNKPKNHSKLKHYSPTITEEVSRPPQRTRQFLPATKYYIYQFQFSFITKKPSCYCCTLHQFHFYKYWWMKQQ